MADAGKNSPLGVNVTGDYMNNTGFTINPVAASYMGSSKKNTTYSFGSCVSETCLRLLTLAINDAYNRGQVLKTPAGSSVYDNLISIGSASIPALGNSKPPTYVPVDPAGVWARTSTSSTALSFAEQYARQSGFTNSLPGPATSGYGNYDGSYGDDLQGAGVTDQKQNATWYPYDMTNPNHSVTQWGWIRCHALQAWNEFNWNGTVVDPDDATLPSYLDGYQAPNYSEFLSSVTVGQSYISQANQSILATANANTFLDGTYSNMNDLISADITGVSLSTIAFGNDLENLGMALDLSTIDSFGLPSNLLRTLGNQGAITQDLSLVLLASGLTSVEISEIVEGVIGNPTEDQERKIYGAMLIMTGENLQSIIAPIQCKTQGFETLADLLDVRKMFPNSYQSLTVPMYNANPGPTNSKTYYLIYSGTGVNVALNSPQMKEYVGTLTPAGNPATSETSTSPANYRDIPQGFDSYLTGILPQNQAIAAGAFSFTMRQISSIETFDVQQFAKVVKGIENVSDLPLTGGTSKPTNQDMIDQSASKGSLGTGPYGSYTMSDLFGCMSGLPYPWKLIKDRINQLETTKLYNIYQELYLAVTWEGAVLAYTVGNNSPSDYFISSISIVDPGGGYGRGGAPAPAISLPYGASATCTIGTDPNNTATFGRLTGVTLVSGGSHTNSSGWYANIEHPPTAGLPVTPGGTIATGGTNTATGTTGWSQPMNQVVQAYIGQANEELASILQNKPTIANYLNIYWNGMGTQLLVEQRVRYKAFSPVAVPKDMFGAPYPSVLLNLIDYIPQLAQDTKPHMSAQFLESISDTSTVGGQSTIAMMRQERNNARLQQLGIEQDNSIPDALTDDEVKQLTTNGTLPGAILGTGIPSCDPNLEFTLPAWPSNMITNTEVQPIPGGTYIPTTSNDPTIITGFHTSDQTAPGDITGILECQLYPSVGPLVPVGPDLTENPYGEGPIIIQPAPEYDPNNLPAYLDPRFTRSTLLPSVPTVKEAIDRVIECNCDCWIG
jgi:hypothetical protein